MDFGMRPRQFMKLLNSSKGEAVFGSRECLVQQGEVADPKTKKLYLLLKGTVNAEVNGRVIATLSEDTPLCFFGEMQLLDLAENGILHRKLMKSSFVDLYECTRIIAHRHDHKHRDGRGSDFDPSDILGYTAEEMEMQEAELFEGEMKDSNVSEGVDAKAQTDEVVSATSETTTATQVETDAAAATTSNQVVISDHNASTSSVMSFVVPEGSTARVLVWDGVSIHV